VCVGGCVWVCVCVEMMDQQQQQQLHGGGPQRLAFLSHAIDELVPIVARTRTMIANQQLSRSRAMTRRGVARNLAKPAMGIELEARLGTVHENGTFEAGVCGQAWQNVLALLMSSNDWDEARSYGWREEQSTHYRIPLNGQSMRTIAVFDRPVVSLVHQRKVPVDRCTLFAVPMADAARANGRCGSACDKPLPRRRRGCDIRVALAQEHAVRGDSVPLLIQPDRVAMRNRRRFAKGAWAIDLALVWAGRTKAEAEQKRTHHAVPEYHIEVECIDPEAYFGLHDNDRHVALSILLRIIDLVDAESTARDIAAGTPYERRSSMRHYHALPRKNGAPVPPVPPVPPLPRRGLMAPPDATSTLSPTASDVGVDRCDNPRSNSRRSTTTGGVANAPHQKTTFDLPSAGPSDEEQHSQERRQRTTPCVQSGQDEQTQTQTQQQHQP